MKRSFKAIITLVLALAMMMSISVAAYADSELPTGKVTYGYNLPDAVPVPMHDLAAENITIDGVDIELYSADGYVYVRLVDLAAAKLLRESADKMAKLGLTLDQLYIKDGLILVKTDGLTEDEVAALTAKVAALTDAVQIAVSVGDKFTLGNAGVAVLYVEIGGFSMPPVEPDKPEPTPGVQTQLNVSAGDVYHFESSSPYAEVTARPETSTLYITYGYIRTFISSEEKYILNSDTYGGYYDVDADQNFAKSISESYIYLVKSENDENTYYYSIDGGKSYTQLTDLGENASDSSIKSTSIVKIFDQISSRNPSDARNVEEVEKAFNTSIMISTDPDGSNVIKTIKYDDVTPKYYHKDNDNYVLNDEVPTAGEFNSLYGEYGDDDYKIVDDLNNSFILFEPKTPIDVETDANDIDVTVNVSNSISFIKENNSSTDGGKSSGGGQSSGASIGDVDTEPTDSAVDTEPTGENA